VFDFYFRVVFELQKLELVKYNKLRDEAVLAQPKSVNPSGLAIPYELPSSEVVVEKASSKPWTHSQLNERDAIEGWRIALDANKHIPKKPTVDQVVEAILAARFAFNVDHREALICARPVQDWHMLDARNAFKTLGIYPSNDSRENVYDNFIILEHWKSSVNKSIYHPDDIRMLLYEPLSKAAMETTLPSLLLMHLELSKDRLYVKKRYMALVPYFSHSKTYEEYTERMNPSKRMILGEAARRAYGYIGDWLNHFGDLATRKYRDSKTMNRR
jgi:hypothetical protein